MHLSTYLDTQKISDSDFAEKIGVTRQAVHRYRTGERFPERPVLAKIAKTTGGKVTANDFIDAPAAPSSRAYSTSRQRVA